MKGRASIAVPSTTSITMRPTTWLDKSVCRTFSHSLEATEPPILCPTITIVWLWYFPATYLRTSSDSSNKLSIDRSKSVILESPWPLKSKEIRVENCFTWDANLANEEAPSPAPCIQKNIIPSDPALYIGVQLERNSWNSKN